MISANDLTFSNGDKCYENNERSQGYKESDPMGGYDPYSSSKGCAIAIDDRLGLNSRINVLSGGSQSETNLTQKAERHNAEPCEFPWLPSCACLPLDCSK